MWLWTWRLSGQDQTDTSQTLESTELHLPSHSGLKLVWGVTCDLWLVTCDLWRVRCDVWRVTYPLPLQSMPWICFLKERGPSSQLAAATSPARDMTSPCSLPGNLARPGPAPSSPGIVLTDRRTDKLWATSSPASFSQVVQGYTQSSAIQLFIFKLQLDFNVGSSGNSEILGVYVCAD